GVDLRHFAGVDVEAGDVEPDARELDRERQADVAEADDADAGPPFPHEIQQGVDVAGAHTFRILAAAPAEAYRVDTRSAACGAAVTRSRSASTIILIRPLKSTFGCHPSCVRAFVLSPMRCSTSAGRISFGSSRTCRRQSRPTCPKATSTRSRTECEMPVAIT